MTTDEKSYQLELETLREQIDVSDQIILDALGKRMKVAESIGILKKGNNVAVYKTNVGLKFWRPCKQREVKEV